MVKFKHNKLLIEEAFNISPDDKKLINKITDIIGITTITWLIQRTWIDERLSDNAKCYLIFCLGREFQRDLLRKGRNT